MTCWPIFFLICFVLTFINGYTYIGTEDSLRQNIKDLSEGKIKFSDKILPHYDGELDDITPKNNSEYDFIVIGAGSTGATIASRLSEIENFTVLLIEAGSKEYPLMDIPAVAKFLHLYDQINWRYQSESSDNYCKGFTDSKCNYSRGKVMGGSSVSNYMVATRGNKENYDEWANISGDESWSYKSMLHYFKKLEDFKVQDLKFDSDIHNKGGPVHISSATYNTPLAKTFIEAGEETGLPKVDFNGRSQIGYSYMQYTINNGERWSVNRAYLYPAKKRTNLFLSRESFVNKILIDEKTKTAIGVNFSKNGKDFVIKAKKEIILSAGAINSPQILMLSGIGPEEHLKSLNISVMKNAPVGDNLIDHVGYGGLIFKTNISLNSIETNKLDPRNPAINNYITNRSGVLAAETDDSAIAFFDVDKPLSTHGNPNIEVIFGANAALKDKLHSEIAGLSDDYKKQIVLNTLDQEHWSASALLTQPKSHGKIRLQSKNPRDKPIIDPNYFDHPDDVKVLIKGIRAIIKLSKTKAFQKYGSQMYALPICGDKEYDSDDYWECAARTFTLAFYHLSGTCKMGQENDTTAVVNSRLRVIGINNLRIADTSIMPNIITGHTHIPTIAIGEKLSDMVKEDWGYSTRDH